MNGKLKKISAFALAAAILALSALSGCPVQAKTTGQIKSIKVTNVKNKKLKLTVGQSKSLKVKVTVKGKISKKVTYKTSNKKIATVTQTGKVKAKKAGTAKITITSKANKKKKVTIKVTVVKKKVTVPSKPTVTPPSKPAEDKKPLTPSNPAATKQDDDLISGAFQATGTVKDVSGLQMVSADDTGKLSSDSALLVWANDKSGWPNAQFMFSEVQDWSRKKTLRVDTKFVNAHNWFAVTLLGYDNDNQIVYSNEMGLDVRNIGWNTTVIDLSAFTGVELKQICGLRFAFNMQDHITSGKLAQVYVDNVYLGTDDDLFEATAISYSGVKSSMLVQEKETNGSNSAIRITTDEQDGWPSIYVPIPDDTDWSLVRSVSLDAKMVHVHPWMAIELYDTDGQKIAEVGKDFTAGDWQNLEVSMSEFTEDKSILATVAAMRIAVNLSDNLGQDAVAILDNLRLNSYNLENREDKEEVSGDFLYHANFVWGPDFQAGTDYFLDNRCEDVNGISGYSWKFSTNTNGNGWPAAQLHLGKKYDLSRVKLQFDVKFECEGDTPTQWISIKLQNSDWADIVADKGIDITGDGWQTVTISPSDWSLLSGKDLTNVELIKFNFNFDNKKGHNQAVYIDNLKLIP